MTHKTLVSQFVTNVTIVTNVTRNNRGAVKGWSDELDVGNDVGADFVVETGDDLGAAHHEFVLDDGGEDADVEGLVLDELLAGETGYAFAHHFLP